MTESVAMEQFAQLKRQVRYCDTKAEQVGDPIDSYRIAASAWHRLLALTGPGPHPRSEADLLAERVMEAEAEVATLRAELREIRER